MYKIIGGDGKEYGPVSADQINQWSFGRVWTGTGGNDRIGNFPVYDPNPGRGASPRIGQGETTGSDHPMREQYETIGTGSADLFPRPRRPFSTSGDLVRRDQTR